MGVKLKKIFLALFIVLFFASHTHAIEIKIPPEGQNDLRAQNVEINDTVFSFGNNVTIDGTINGDLYVFGKNIYINGIINGNVFTVGSQITINAEISRDLVVLAKDFSLSEKALIKQDLKGRANQIKIPVSTQILGKTSLMKLENETDFRSTLPNLLSLIFTALILQRIFPKFSHDLVEISRANRGRTLLFGVLTYILVILAVGILLFSMIGAPIALILLGIFLLDLYLAYVASGLIIGNLLFTDKINKYYSMIFGIVIIRYIKYIPGIGSPIFLIAYLFGFGSIILTKIKYFEKIKK